MTKNLTVVLLLAVLVGCWRKPTPVVAVKNISSWTDAAAQFQGYDVHGWSYAGGRHCISVSPKGDDNFTHYWMACGDSWESAAQKTHAEIAKNPLPEEWIVESYHSSR